MYTGKKYFFVPRKGNLYENGLYGSRTLIVGAYHVCDLDCGFSDKCVANSLSMDRECPVYKGKDSYYRLSNSNIIEIDSFVNSDAKYPSYSEFTKYILSKKDYVSDEEKQSLWEKLAFYNYAQNYKKTYQPFDESKDRDRLDKDFEAFKEVIEELRPEVIYVWHDAIKDVIDRHISEIQGLRYIAETNMQSLTVHCYTILTDRCSYIDSYKDRLGLMSRSEKIGFISKCIDLCSNIRKFDYKSLADKSELMEGLSFALFLDDDFERQLYNDLVFAYFDNEDSNILKTMLAPLYDYGLIKDETHYVFTTLPHAKKVKSESSSKEYLTLKYERSGFLCYLYNLLIKEKTEAQTATLKHRQAIKDKFRMTESIFAYGLGYSKTLEEWRSLKKEYTDTVKCVKDFDFKQIYEEIKNSVKTNKPDIFK